MSNQTPCTLEDVREALAYVSPEERETWVLAAFAIKTEFGDAGFDTWDTWSQGAASYKPADAKSVWRSAKPGRGVGIGSLFKLAVDNGFKFRERSDEDQARLEAEAAARREKVAEQQAKEDARHAEKVRTCGERAKQIWSKLPDSGKSEYLNRKKVGAYGVRFSRGSIVVPVRNAAGDLVGLQFVDADGNKKFLTGTPKSGCWHLIGEMPAQDDAQALVWIAEGYATGATVYMATGCPVAVAFDAGNLMPVAKALRALLPAARFAIAADNDSTTPGNPGVSKAQAAAQDVGAVVVAPEGVAA